VIGAARALLLLRIAPAVLSGQVRPPTPVPPTPVAPRPQQAPRRPDSTVARRMPRFPGDTVRRDSAKVDTVATWLPVDATMQALMKRPNVSVTRYEGNVVSFNNSSNAFSVKADSAQRAQVERDGQRIDTDSTIVARDRHIDVNGKFRMVAGGGQPPVAGFGSASYDLTARSGRLTNAELTVDETGAKWYVTSEIGKMMRGDSARNIPQRFYGVGGTLTSCDDSVPDYHFAMKEIKRTNRTLVARPAVMYIRDIPVMWFPFFFQDIRSGRRSGVLPPRFGVSDIVRNNPNYRRHVENVGYYWAPSDYVDFASWVDWRSSAGGDSLDPGWYKANFEWRYNWASRFLTGGLATSYQRTTRGNDNTQVSWSHQQRFGERSFNANVNYVTSTQLQRQNTFSTYQAMSTIRSSFNYSDHIGPAKMQLGGGRTQYPGRRQVDQDLPKFSITSPALALFSWLTWTPAFSYSETSHLHLDSPWQFTQRFIADSTGRLIRGDSLNRTDRDRSISFDTPLRFFKYEFRSGIRIHDWSKNYPEQRDVFVNADSSRRETRVFQTQFATELDWNPTFALPLVNQNRFKLTPSVSLANVDNGHAFWVRSYLSGGQWAHNSKRLMYSLSVSPTVFGILPGFGPFERIRHSISPTLSYNIAPEAKISREYLSAIGAQYDTYRGTLPMSSVSFGFSQAFEAKVRSPQDSTTDGSNAQKIKLLSMNFSPLSYDFQRAKNAGRKLAGLTTENVGARVSSDLLPGMDFSLDYSLFRGSTITDTAEFDPFLTHVSTSVRFSNRENPFALVRRLFAGPDQRGLLSRDSAARLDQTNFASQGSQQVAGQGARNQQFYVPTVDGWQANLGFSMSRQRKPRPGDQVLSSDPRVLCDRYLNINPFAYQQCYNSPTDVPPASPYGGGPQIIGPPQISVNGDLRFRVTEKWSASWRSSFDFVRHEFASQEVTLVRDLHDWRSIFAFTRSPNGNFAFTFNIALKPQPDLKFDYSKASYRTR